MADLADISEWANIFEEHWGGYFGYVRDLNAAKNVVHQFSVSTSTSYAVERQTKCFGTYKFGEEDTHNHRILYDDVGYPKHSTSIHLSGVPFIVVGCRVLECQFGPDRRRTGDYEAGDHRYQQRSEVNTTPAPKKKRRKVKGHGVTGTKKIGCRAIVYMREIIAFPEYKVEHNTRHYRKAQSENLRADMHSVAYADIVAKKYIFIDLPKEHTNHIVSKADDLKAPVDPSIHRLVYGLVRQGVSSTKEVQRFITMHVEQQFLNKAMPHSLNRRYYPSKDDVKGMVKNKRKSMKNDQLRTDPLSGDTQNQTLTYDTTFCVSVEDGDETGGDETGGDEIGETLAAPSPITPSASDLGTTAKMVREELIEITDLSYRVHDVNTLHSLASVLKSIKERMLQSVPEYVIQPKAEKDKSAGKRQDPCESSREKKKQKTVTISEILDHEGTGLVWAEWV